MPWDGVTAGNEDDRCSPHVSWVARVALSVPSQCQDAGVAVLNLGAAPRPQSAQFVCCFADTSSQLTTQSSTRDRYKVGS